MSILKTTKPGRCRASWPLQSLLWLCFVVKITRCGLVQKHRHGDLPVGLLEGSEPTPAFLTTLVEDYVAKNLPVVTPQEVSAFVWAFVLDKLVAEVSCAYLPSIQGSECGRNASGMLKWNGILAMEMAFSA